MRSWSVGAVLASIGVVGILCAPAPARAGETPDVSAVVSVGARYDSNVSVEQADLNTRQGDIAALLSASVDATLVDNGALSLRAGYDFDQTIYEGLSDFDLQIHKARAGGSLRTGRASFDADYTFAYVLLGGHQYLDMHLVAPSASGFITRNLFLRAGYLYIDKRFVDSDRLDADAQYATIDAYRYFARRKGYVALGLRYEREDAKARELDYRGVQASVRVQVPVKLTTTAGKARVGYSFGERDYDSVTPSIGEKRKEHRHTLNASLEIPLTDALTLRPQVRYTIRSSNQPSADYNEVVASSVVSFKF